MLKRESFQMMYSNLGLSFCETLPLIFKLIKLVEEKAPVEMLRLRGVQAFKGERRTLDSYSLVSAAVPVRLISVSAHSCLGCTPI